MSWAVLRVVVEAADVTFLPAGAPVLLLNLDDFGRYGAVNVAVVRSIEDGVAASCSLMVPCPGARQALQLLRRRPEIRFGIHLTLVCDTAVRPWGPLAPTDDVPSLLDDQGRLFTPAHVSQLLARARLDEVELEFRRQIDAVADAGLTPTHLDWHCLTDGGRDDIFDLTLALADEYGLALRAWLEPARQKLRRRGVPVVDNDFLDSFSLGLDGKAARYAELLRTLPAGLTEWALHPAVGDDEARAVDQGWRVRASDYDFLTSPETRRLLAEQQIIVTDYRPLQQAARAVNRKW